MNENTPGFCLSGFLIMMEMPRFMKGFEKSNTLSRTDEIVIGAIAMSASWVVCGGVEAFVVVLKRLWWC